MVSSKELEEGNRDLFQDNCPKIRLQRLTQGHKNTSRCITMSRNTSNNQTSDKRQVTSDPRYSHAY